jgi:hypothetical protein
MVKLDYERDYYADLGLPPTADAADVKRQFKKLGRLRSPQVQILIANVPSHSPTMASRSQPG